MPHEYFWGSGMWIFPTIAMIFGFTVMLICILIFVGKGGRPPWQGRGGHSGEDRGTETALDVLKKRYAKGEITKEEFEQMKKDIQS